MLTTILLAAADEPSRGWGGPIALGVVIVVYVAGATLHAHFRPDADPSPAEGDTPGVSVNPQVGAVSDTDDTDADTGWWGRIVDRDGRRVRVAEPVDEPDDEDGQEDVDESEPIEDVIARMEDRGVTYMGMVRHLMDEFEVSEATAKRRIREVRTERSAA